LLLAAVPGVIILLNAVRGDVSQALALLVQRLVETGGGDYNYFARHGNRVFDEVGTLERLSLYFDGLLAPLRLKEWADPNRVNLVSQYLTGKYISGTGQNPYFFVDSHFLFGPVVGMVWPYFLARILVHFRNQSWRLAYGYIGFSWGISLFADIGVAYAVAIGMLPLLFVMALWKLLKAGSIQIGRKRSQSS